MTTRTTIPLAMSSALREAGRECAGLTARLGVFLLLSTIVINAVPKLLAPPDSRETVIDHTVDAVRARTQYNDSWRIMSTAHDYARRTHDTPLYTEIFFNRRTKFQYPPSSLFAVAALRAVSADRFRSTDPYFGANPSLDDLVSWGFLLVMALTVAALLEIRLRRGICQRTSWRESAMRAAIAVALTLTFYPVVKAYTVGQIQVWLNALFAVALLAWVLRWKAVAGALLGVICLIKPQYGLFVLWGAVRREWRFTGACVSIVVVGLAASIASFGLADHLDYVRVLSYLSRHGEGYYPNQSVNGLLNRWMDLYQPGVFGDLEFWPNRFPPPHPLVYWGTLATSVLILLAAIARRFRGDEPVLDLCTMALSCTIASPIAWEHHYGILLPIYAVALSNVLRSRTRLTLFMISYLIASSFLPWLNRLSDTGLNVAQSYLFLAAVLLLVLLYRIRSTGSDSLEVRPVRATTETAA